MSLPPGTRLGPYEIRAAIGSGGMGDIYKALDTRLGRAVAIKVLPAAAVADPKRKLRFVREAKTASALNHPGIVTIHDIGSDKGIDFIAMEYLPGKTLGELIGYKGLGLREALNCAVQVADALHAAHAIGVVHRDLKPANIMVSDSGLTKVLDFGLAKMPGGEALTQTGVAVGTCTTMSPEQTRGEKVDHRTDIWSLGVVLYQMLTGQLPFQGGYDQAVLYQILNEQPRPPSALCPGVPARLDAIVMKCLEKDRDRRHASAAELYDELVACQAQLFDRRVTLRAVVRNPRVAIPAGVMLMAMLAGAIAFGVHSHGVRRARATMLPEITSLVEKRDYWAAFLLARQAEAILGDEPLLARLRPEFTSHIVWNVKPDGAEVYARRPGSREDAWTYLGRTGAGPLATAKGLTVFKVEHPATEPWVFAMPVLGREEKVEGTLSARGQVPPRMVRIDAGQQSWLLLNFFDYDWPDAGPIGSFLIDMYEVTNREFKQFVDAGGYRRREFWKQPFERGGRAVSWDEAKTRFHDTTGRPGPATWALGSFPDGQADYPVTGVSWYEAAAYAEFVGKRLPTIYHWGVAAGIKMAGYFVAVSNFSGRISPVGSYAGSLNWRGIYDMAGNAREWCANAIGDERITLGEAADGSTHYFHAPSPRAPFDRSPGNGFRCIKAIDDSTQAGLDQPLRRLPESAMNRAKPFSDAEWKIWQSFLAYAEKPLEARTELVDDSHPAWRMEKVSFTAAYEGEPMLVYLLLPRNVPPPYQAVVFWPGGYALEVASSGDGNLLLYHRYWEYLVKTGRVVVFPILKRTFERGGAPPPAGKNVFDVCFEMFDDQGLMAMQAKDISRSVDYLESRPDIAANRVAYVGFSWGAFMGPLACAAEKRFKAGILLSGAAARPVMAGWASRVTTPMLMVNGRYDYMPYETAQRPLFQAFATPDKDKRHIVFETEHSLGGFENEMIKCSLEWLDRYLGSVK